MNLEEKKALLRQLGTAEDLARLRDLVNTIPAKLLETEHLKSLIRMRKEDLGIQEAGVVVDLSLVGWQETVRRRKAEASEDSDKEEDWEEVVFKAKNEAEREALIARAKLGDATYILFGTEIQEAEGRLELANFEAERAQREWGALQTVLRLRTAQIEFLADRKGES